MLWNERARITPQPAEPRTDVRQRFASGFQTKSASFFAVFLSALMVWAYEAMYYWGYWWGYWGYPHKTTYAKWFLIVVAIVGIASLLAGFFVRLHADD